MTIMGLLWIILYCCTITTISILIFGIKPVFAYKTRHGKNGSRKKILDSVPLILVTSGAESYTGFLDSTELLDITGRTRPCAFSHLPYKYYGATGGYLPGLGPVVCGGSSEESSDECYLLRRSVEGTLNLDYLMTKREGASSVVFTKPQPLLWVTGGTNGYPTDSTEIISNLEESSQKFRNILGSLPEASAYHAMVSIERYNSAEVWLIGGWTKKEGKSTKTWKFNFDFTSWNGKWQPGPDLEKGRVEHAAGVITDHTTMDKYVVVTGGRDESSNSVEVLVNEEWISGEAYLFCIMHPTI